MGSVLRSWQREGSLFSVEGEDRSVELLVDGVGWCLAHALYTIRHHAPVGPDDTTTWRVLKLGEPAVSRVPNDAVLVVEVSEQTGESHGEFAEATTEVCSWFVPTRVAAAAREFEAKDWTEIGKFLLKHAVPIAYGPELAIGRLEGKELPRVAVAAIDPEVRSLLGSAAARAAQNLHLRLRSDPVAAANLYTESGPADNMNQTVVCRWAWRLAWPPCPSIGSRGARARARRTSSRRCALRRQEISYPERQHSGVPLLIVEPKSNDDSSRSPKGGLGWIAQS